MNHLDLPPPDPPEGQKPMTFPEMLEVVTNCFEALEAAQDIAPGAPTPKDRAWIALNKVYEAGWLDWWGMSEDGEPAFVPSTPEVRRVVYIIKER